MPKLTAFVLHGHDNDSYMLQGCTNLVRCPVCGELLERPRLVARFKIKKKRDISATYDGYTIVSQLFVDAWKQLRGSGLEFWPLSGEPGYFAVHATRVVEFDVERRKTRFENFRSCCERYDSVAGATPAFLKANELLSPNQAVRTDVMFGSGDGKHPLTIIPLEFGRFLKRAKLTGLDLGEVLA